MIDTGKINQIIEELDNVASEMKNATTIRNELDEALALQARAIETLNNVLAEMEKYDRKTEALEKQTNVLAEKVQDIRLDYHKVSNVVDILDDDYRNIQKGIEGLNIELQELANNFSAKLCDVKNEIGGGQKEVLKSVEALAGEVKVLKKIVIGFGVGLVALSLAVLAVILV